MAANSSDADVILNRINVSLARSQKLINSWLPKAADSAPGQATQSEDDDDKFRSMSEKGGIGSRAAYGDEELPDGAFQRRKLGSNDRLLEQLIGKKAAQAKRRQHDASKNMPATIRAAPKPDARQMNSKHADDSGDEEEGRAAAFKSRKTSRSATFGRPAVELRDDSGDDDLANGRKGEGEARESLREVPGRSGKRKATSYLDQMLAQKGKKKSKKKGHHTA